MSISRQWTLLETSGVSDVIMYHGGYYSVILRVGW